MNWTKAHSQNAVVAKARKRIERATNPPPETRRRLPHPRGRAKWRIQIRDLEHGDSITLTLHRLPWPARYVDMEGQQFSAAKLGKAIRVLLTQGA